jgi:predicted nuclease of restriction endonuclease-like RecB superfamily
MRYIYSKCSRRISTKENTKEVIKMYQADIDKLVGSLLEEIKNNKEESNDSKIKR